MRIKLLLSLGLIFVACTRAPETNDQCLYHNNGTPKPKIALIPVIDNANTELSWSLSDEFSETMRSKIGEGGKFYFTSDFDVLSKTQLDALSINPFVDDLDWIQEMISPTEFIVFTELAKHKLTPKSRHGVFFGAPSYTLEISLRIKVVDIRSNHPKVVLQELIQNSFSIPWRLSSVDYKNVAFFMSPLGIAHMHMIKSATKQIEEYILLAQPAL